MSELLLDRAGRRRSPATKPGFHAGRSPANKGLRYPADPPHRRGDHRHDARGWRGRARPAAPRAGGDALASWLTDSGSAFARGVRPRPATRVADRSPREGRTASRVGMDAWGLAAAAAVAQDTRGASGRRSVLHRHRNDPRTTLGERRGACRPASNGRPSRRAPPLAPHHLRHAHAVEMAHEGVPLVVIQRQLGHSKSRDHFDLPPGDRQRRDHRHRPCPADSDGASQRPLALLSTQESIQRTALPRGTARNG